MHRFYINENLLQRIPSLKRNRTVLSIRRMAAYFTLESSFVLTCDIAIHITELNLFAIGRVMFASSFWNRCTTELPSKLSFLLREPSSRATDSDTNGRRSSTIESDRAPFLARDVQRHHSCLGHSTSLPCCLRSFRTFPWVNQPPEHRDTFRKCLKITTTVLQVSAPEPWVWSYFHYGRNTNGLTIPLIIQLYLSAVDSGCSKLEPSKESSRSLAISRISLHFGRGVVASKSFQDLGAVYGD